MDKKNKDDAISYFRYSVIEPLIYASPGKVKRIAEELSRQTFKDWVHHKNVTYSERQLFRMLKRYREEEFDGLKTRSKKNKGTNPSVPLTVQEKLLELKKEHPARSAYKIIRILEIAGEVEEGSLHPRTVNRILVKTSYTKADLSKDTRPYKLHEKEEINMMWQSDVMQAIYLNDQKLCYLIGFLDDCSRVITHGQFYYDSTLPKLEDALKKGVTKHGIPERLYIDNAKIYVSRQFKIICAKLNIRLIYGTPYHPEGRGKNERVWDYIQNSFINEVRLNKVNSINELNDLFFAWLKAEYHDKPHHGLPISSDNDANAAYFTPSERWNLSLRNGRKIIYKSPLELDNIFLHEEYRKVNRYGVISFQGNTYEAPGQLVGKRVTVKFDPFDLKKVKIYFQDKYIDTARIIDLKKTNHRDVDNVVIEEKIDSDISRKYFENLKINYLKYLDEQANSFIQRDQLKKDDHSLVDDEKNKPAPKDKKAVISKDEFVKLVARSLGEEHLGYPEKVRLYDLWQDLKDFDPAILRDFLAEVKMKSNDYHINFLCYVEQIRNLYLRRDSK